MEFKDYYAVLGLAHGATPAEVKRAYRKLARRYHPDVSREPDAETRFKEVAEAHEALIDPDRRAAYDAIAQRHADGQPFEPPPGWDPVFAHAGRADRPARSPRGQAGPVHEAEDFSDFFEAMFGRSGMPPRGPGDAAGAGRDHHAQVAIDLLDACLGARREFVLHVPVADGSGRPGLQERRLEVAIPKGAREGQRLRLAGQGAAGRDGAPAGDLYLEIRWRPHPLFRVDGRDLSFDLPVAPWEAALGATVHAPTPEGPVALTVPPESAQGRRLRLKGRGLPGPQPGDLYAVLSIVLPPSAPGPQQDAYKAFAQAFPGYDPRAAWQA